MADEDRSLRDALWRWIADAVEFIDGRYDSDAPFLAIAADREALRELGSFSEASTALEDDDAVKPHLNNFVGTPHEQTRWTTDELLDSLLNRCLRDVTALPLEEAFDRSFASFSSSFTSQTISVETVVPLIGFESALDASVELIAGVWLRRLTQDELDKLASPFGLGPFFHRNTSWALASVTDLPKVIRSPPEAGPPAGAEANVTEAQQLRRDVAYRIRLTVQAMHLFGQGRFSSHITMESSDSWFGEHSSHVPLRYPGPSRLTQFSLGADDARSFVDFMDSVLAGIERYPRLGVAVRRFYYSTERARVEDELVDLVIAAESLLLDDEAELRLKFALRAALWLRDTDADPPGTIFSRFHSMYGSRNRVVHGGEQALTRDDVTSFKSDVRRAILKATERAGNGNLSGKEAVLKSDKWSDLLFPD